MKPILARLNTWRKTDEDEEFVDKAIDSLFKKLKTKQGRVQFDRLRSLVGYVS